MAIWHAQDLARHVSGHLADKRFCAIHQHLAHLLGIAEVRRVNPAGATLDKPLLFHLRCVCHRNADSSAQISLVKPDYHAFLSVGVNFPAAFDFRPQVH